MCTFVYMHPTDQREDDVARFDRPNNNFFVAGARDEVQPSWGGFCIFPFRFLKSRYLATGFLQKATTGVVS